MNALFGRAARLRWVHLILGGALLMPYFLLTTTVLDMTVDRSQSAGVALAIQLAGFALALPLVATTAVFPVVRSLEGAAARALCAVDGIETGPARSWAARWRTAVWFVLHVGLGGVVSGMTLAVPPAVVVLVLAPLFSGLRPIIGFWGPALTLGQPALAPLSGVLLLALLLAVAVGSGRLLARCAPVLLGPTPTDLLAAAERRAVRLAARNRLARELHDSVGHALSAVTLQAAAARRVLSDDPAFARQALEAIEQTTRRAVAELDDVLGLLREEGEGPPSGPTLGALDELLERTAATGVELTTDIPGALDRLPPAVSREAYRIVQEGLTNAQRHAGPVPVRLRIAADEDELEIELTNPLGTVRPRRSGGGRGLRGIEERATVLRGRVTAGPYDGGWRLAVRLPLRREAR
ncbi:histidine kinase [Streptomyces sp. NPDC020096]